jgi:hypothetical protein
MKNACHTQGTTQGGTYGQAEYGQPGLYPQMLSLVWNMPYKKMNKK